MAFADLIAITDRAVQSHLGEPVSYRSADGTTVTPAGVFDESYVVVGGDAGPGVESTHPAVFLLLADLPRDPETDDPTLTIRSVDYHVIERKPDGVGGILLVLHRAVV